MAVTLCYLLSLYSPPASFFFISLPRLSAMSSPGQSPLPCSPSLGLWLKERLSRAAAASSKHLEAPVAPSPLNKDSGYVLAGLLCNLAAG